VTRKSTKVGSKEVNELARALLATIRTAPASKRQRTSNRSTPIVLEDLPTSPISITSSPLVLRTKHRQIPGVSAWCIGT
jgi:hypothetical protein